MTQLPSKVKQIQLTIPKEVDKEKEKVISFSQFQIYQQCPYRWSQQYIHKKGRQQPNINLTFGTAIHQTIQHYLQKMYDVSGVKADEIDLNEYFEKAYIEEFTKQVIENGNIKFSSEEEMREYYNDGVQILDWFKKHRKDYFTTRGWTLVGVEVPMLFPLNDEYPNVLFKGSLDLVLYENDYKNFKIIDFKTSKQSGGAYQKADETKIAQLLLYKQFFAKHFDIDVEKIEIEFIILKRKLYENSEFPQKRLQSFIPPSGTGKRNKAVENITNFIKESFTQDGKFIEKEHPKKIGKLCDWCQFNNTPDCIK